MIKSFNYLLRGRLLSRIILLTPCASTGMDIYQCDQKKIAKNAQK